MDIGDLVAGRYLLRERLGHGATAMVFRADDRELDRIVAIKVFGPASEVSDAERRRREARSLARLRHPAIVTIFDARLDADPPFLVLEYVPGTTLAERLHAGALDRDTARRVVAGAASGLAAAHDAGIVHRDLKPANILLPDAGDVPARLLDFGIAHALGDPRQTIAGSVLGSASYLSPEQVRGEDVTPASDVYSLGLVLIECMLGTPAFPGDVSETIAARLADRPRLDDPALEGLRELLARMTDPDPSQRPSAAEVRTELSADADAPAATRVLPAGLLPGAPDAPVVATEALDPAPTHATAPRERFRRRRPSPALVGIGLVTAVMLTGAAVAGTMSAGVADASVVPATGSPTAAEGAPKFRLTEVASDPEPAEPEPGPGAGNGNPHGPGGPGGPGNGNGNGPKDG